VPNGKDSLVKPMEPSAFHRPLNGTMGVSDSPKLADRYDSMLAVSQRGQLMAPP